MVLIMVDKILFFVFSFLFVIKSCYNAYINCYPGYFFYLYGVEGFIANVVVFALSSIMLYHFFTNKIKWLKYKDWVWIGIVVGSIDLVVHSIKEFCCMLHNVG